MTTLARKLIYLLLAFSLTACFRVPMEAPYGPDVKILARDEPVEVTRRYQKWYAIWGIFPLDPSSNPADIVAREHLVEARIYHIYRRFRGRYHCRLFLRDHLPGRDSFTTNHCRRRQSRSQTCCYSGWNRDSSRQYRRVLQKCKDRASISLPLPIGQTYPSRTTGLSARYTSL